MKDRFVHTACICILTICLCCVIINVKEPAALQAAANTPKITETENKNLKIEPIIMASIQGSGAQSELLLCGGVQEFVNRLEPIVALPEEESEYADFAIANVSRYVNVRKEPNTDSEIVGKIYNGAVAHVLSAAGEDNDWFQMISGNVEGYIKAEYFFYGEEAAAVIDDYVTRYAVVQASRLNVRKEPDINSKRIGFINNGERVKLLENQGEWLKVQYAGDSTGYVAAEYVTIVEEFVYAKTLEEEAAELAAKKALEARKQVSEQQAAENTAITVTPPAQSYSSNEELRSQIIEYSMQFVGNKYVHGGQTLSGGTDCSGFTSLIYAQFGYSLSRTPGGQLSGAGRSVDYSNAQPGDIICYGSGQTCTHVALYLGDGQIIHSANPRKGVVTQAAGFDTIIGVKSVVD
ncbi:MAG: C40 family peptidase [Bacteroidales bacterium]|nr:C40 family peptidase [Lachnoclostridium sp.]MCM1385627.1 C40 family peptidase [Lachnoclostridium sp.]MCM1466275.1 C40 family peptidase [Bacteroidales bacterium]